MKKVSFYGLLLAFGLVLSYVESLIPLDFIIPGIKLGLANFIVVLLLYRAGAGTALFINIVRIVISGLLFGNVMSFWYAVAGGLFSFAVMVLCKRFKCFSPVGVSLAGGAAHQAGQVAAAAAVLRTTAVFGVLPVLLAAGVLCGAVTGFLAAAVNIRLGNRGI